MADDDKTVWAKVGFHQPVDDLIQHGPTAPVDIRVAGQSAFQALALFDTGAAGTGLSPALVARLGIVPTGEGFIHEAGREPIAAHFFPVHIAIPGLPWVELDAEGLPSLAPPHDILIGRDVLASFRFSIDFTEGRVALHFRHGQARGHG